MVVVVVVVAGVGKGRGELGMRRNVLMRCVAGISLVSSSLGAAEKGSEAGVVAKRHDIACRYSRRE